MPGPAAHARRIIMPAKLRFIHGRQILLSGAGGPVNTANLPRGRESKGVKRGRRGIYRAAGRERARGPGKGKDDAFRTPS